MTAPIQYSDAIGENILCNLDSVTQKDGFGENPAVLEVGQPFHPITVTAAIWWTDVANHHIAGTPIQGAPVSVTLRSAADKGMSVSLVGDKAPVTDATGKCTIQPIYSGGIGEACSEVHCGNQYFGPIAFVSMTAPAPAVWTEAQLRAAMSAQGWTAIDTGNPFSGPWVIAKGFIEVPGGKGPTELAALQSAVNAAGLKAS